MKRSRSITLALLGGGIILAGCGEGARARECRAATEAQRPDAQQICARSQARSSSGGHAYLGSWYYGRGASQQAGLAGQNANASAISRGGFGSRGASGG
ncbi:MAG: hypothetical protein JWO26_3330 [Rhodospirillales bacterium]|jgi:hypothetical protein|nr:hypothetical protein [Rhodospirillales bacterium]